MIFQIPDILLNIFHFIDKLTLITKIKLVSKDLKTLSQYELTYNRKTKWEQTYENFTQLKQLENKSLKNYGFPNIKFLMDYSSGTIVVWLIGDKHVIYLTHFFDTSKFCTIVETEKIESINLVEIPHYKSKSGKQERLLNINYSDKSFVINYTNFNEIHNMKLISPSMKDLFWKLYTIGLRYEDTCDNYKNESVSSQVVKCMQWASDTEVYVIHFSRELKLFVVYLFSHMKLIKRTSIQWESYFNRGIIKIVRNSKIHILINDDTFFYLFDLRLCTITMTYKCDLLFRIRRAPFLILNESQPILISFGVDGIFLYRDSSGYTKIDFGHFDNFFGLDEEMKLILCNDFHTNSLFRIHIKSLLKLPIKSHLFKDIKDQLNVIY